MSTRERSCSWMPARCACACETRRCTVRRRRDPARPRPRAPLRRACACGCERRTAPRGASARSGARRREHRGEDGPRARAFVPEESEIVVELAPYLAYEIEVVDAASGAGIPGAELEVWSDFPVPMPLPGQESRLGTSLASTGPGSRSKHSRARPTPEVAPRSMGSRQAIAVVSSSAHAAMDRTSTNPPASLHATARRGPCASSSSARRGRCAGPSSRAKWARRRTAA